MDTTIHIGPESYATARHYQARCQEPGCTEALDRWLDYSSEELNRSYVKGWFREHVLATGHTIIVTVSQPEPVPAPALSEL